MPRIAVTGMHANQVHGLRFAGNAVAVEVLRSVVRAGGEAVTLFAESPEDPIARLRNIDGLLIPGGADLDPRRYGQHPDPATALADAPGQDDFEAELLRAALALGMPVLAICRGFQLLNVEHGGTLCQDLPVDSRHRDDHHDITVASDSLLADVLGATTIDVSSYHHQAVEQLGDGLRVVGTASDGIIEALEVPGKPVLAVQWHPEDTAEAIPHQHALFSWLTREAARYRARNSMPIHEHQSVPRVLIVEHQNDAGVGVFGDRLRAAGVELVVVGPEAAPLPDSLDGYAGLIVLGGSMGPLEDEVAPWLPAVRQLIARALETETPMLGICLGAQLLATVAGGRVREMRGGPEIGLRGVRFAPAAQDDALFRGLQDDADPDGEVPVVQWHWLESADLPERATVFASSEQCSNQAFRIGAAAWGVQFHPEALAETARAWSAADERQLRELSLDSIAIVDAVRSAEPRLRVIWAGLADRFAAIAANAKSSANT